MSNPTATTPKTDALAPVAPSSALAIIDPRAAIAPRNMKDVWDYCLAVSQVGLCGVKSPEEAMIRMATGMELGLSAMQSMRSVYVIEGRPSLAADLMVGLCLSRPDICEHFDLIETSDKIAVYSIKRRGRPALRFQYTIEQAQKAGLTNRKPWQANPSAMLRARASSQGARAIFADLMNGLHTADELADVAYSSQSTDAPAQYEATVVGSVVAEKTQATATTAETRAAGREAMKTMVEPKPEHAPASATAPDYDALSIEAGALISAAATIADCDALPAKLAKLAPKGSPHRRALADALAAKREALLNAPPVEATQDAEPDFGTRENFE